jgi:hypothetical protein
VSLGDKKAMGNVTDYLIADQARGRLALMAAIEERNFKPFSVERGALCLVISKNV